MKMLDRSGIYLEIVSDVLDSPIYSEIVGVFKFLKFYQTADFVLPAFSDKIVINAVGEAGVNYRVEFSDVVYDFVETMDLVLTGDMLASRVVTCNVYKEGKFAGNVEIAFVNYIVYAYVAVQVYLEFSERLKEAKESRYLIENTEYVEGFNDYFGTLLGIQKLENWGFEEYRELIIQLISALKATISETSFREVTTAIGYKYFAENVKDVCNLGAGFNHIDNSKWEVELV